MDRYHDIIGGGRDDGGCADPVALHRVDFPECHHCLPHGATNQSMLSASIQVRQQWLRRRLADPETNDTMIP